jgi:RNA 2',3'-cyclic 3'-phosphodiesterase
VSGLRLIDARWLHVTLCFLGGRPLDEVGEIAAACRAAVVPEALPLSLGEALWLPPRRPRVVAVELVDALSRLAELQAAVSAGLASGGFYEPETRPFLGHVTVGRVGRGGRVGRSPAEPLPPPSPVAFDAEAVTLYRSRLGRGGARYEALETIALGHPTQKDGQ